MIQIDWCLMPTLVIVQLYHGVKWTGNAKCCINTKCNAMFICVHIFWMGHFHTHTHLCGMLKLYNELTSSDLQFWNRTHQIEYYVILFFLVIFASIWGLGWGVLNTTLCGKVCQWLVTGRWFSPGTLVSSTNKTEILLKMALNTITLTLYIWANQYFINLISTHLRHKCIGY